MPGPCPWLPNVGSTADDCRLSIPEGANIVVRNERPGILAAIRSDDNVIQGASTIPLFRETIAIAFTLDVAEPGTILARQRDILHRPGGRDSYNGGFILRIGDLMGYRSMNPSEGVRLSTYVGSTEGWRVFKNHKPLLLAGVTYVVVLDVDAAYGQGHLRMLNSWPNIPAQNPIIQRTTTAFLAVFTRTLYAFGQLCVSHNMKRVLRTI